MCWSTAWRRRPRGAQLAPSASLRDTRASSEAAAEQRRAPAAPLLPLAQALSNEPEHFRQQTLIAGSQSCNIYMSEKYLLTV